MAKERSREAFILALRENRFYASESGNIKLLCSVNGHSAPCDLSLTDTYKFHIDISNFRDEPDTHPEKIMVISDYGSTVFELDARGNSSFDFELHSESARYFYLRIIDKRGRKTWSPPVWCGRAFDNDITTQDIAPLDMSEVSAYYNGKEIPEIINGNPYESYLFDSPICEIILDMKEEREICALGYYPRLVLRDERKGGIAGQPLTKARALSATIRYLQALTVSNTLSLLAVFSAI